MKFHLAMTIEIDEMTVAEELERQGRHMGHIAELIVEDPEIWLRLARSCEVIYTSLPQESD